MKRATLPYLGILGIEFLAVLFAACKAPNSAMPDPSKGPSNDSSIAASATESVQSQKVDDGKTSASDYPIFRPRSVAFHKNGTVEYGWLAVDLRTNVGSNEFTFRKKGTLFFFHNGVPKEGFLFGTNRFMAGGHQFLVPPNAYIWFHKNGAVRNVSEFAAHATVQVGDQTFTFDKEYGGRFHDNGVVKEAMLAKGQEHRILIDGKEKVARYEYVIDFDREGQPIRIVDVRLNK